VCATERNELSFSYFLHAHNICDCVPSCTHTLCTLIVYPHVRTLYPHCVPSCTHTLCTLMYARTHKCACVLERARAPAQTQSDTLPTNVRACTHIQIHRHPHTHGNTTKPLMWPRCRCGRGSASACGGAPSRSQRCAAAPGCRRIHRHARTLQGSSGGE